jgi:uncharacterized protein YecE (DUF72 family)
MINVGTAGWSIPRSCANEFPADGSSLERYATRFRIAEINSSFHRRHRPSTWERWRDSVPADFRFSVKVPKAVTHTRKLDDCSSLVDEFASDVSELRDKLAVLLVQLPPKFQFDNQTASCFFQRLGDRTTATIACEPRHPSWFTQAANKLLQDLDVARVAADPAICHAAAVPGEWTRLAYWRLHGSPVTYRSSYLDHIPSLATQLMEEAKEREVWCIFDNTASSAGAVDALALQNAIKERHRVHS